MLEELGFVYAVDLEDGCIRYELNRVDQVHRHHHLLCERCGKVTEVKDDLLDEIEAKIYKNYGFTIRITELNSTGSGAECQRKALVAIVCLCSKTM